VEAQSDLVEHKRCYKAQLAQARGIPQPTTRLMTHSNRRYSILSAPAALEKRLSDARQPLLKQIADILKMARGNVDTARNLTLSNAIEDIKGSTIRQRDEGLRSLRELFAKAENINVLTDSAYHSIFEELFRVVLSEKHSVSSAKKTTKVSAISRLRACADAVRIVAQSGAPKLKAKSVESVVDHIIQTLPNADGEYCEHIAQHYLKTLCIVFERGANVEYLKQKTWNDTVEFCLQGLNQYLGDNEADPSDLARSLSGHGTNRFSGSLANSSVNGRSQSQSGPVSRQNAEDLLQALSCLVTASNAPLSQRCDEIADTIISILSAHGSTVSRLQKIAFSILNAILSVTREDRLSLSKAIAQEAVPVICRFWQGKSVAKDEMLSSVRDEMLIFLFLTHLHLERSILEEINGVASNLSDLLEVMRAEYARRSERDQLQLEDIDISDIGSVGADATPFRMHDFRLRLHNIRAERNWANLQVIGILERLVRIGDQQKDHSKEMMDGDTDKHPRKRRRTDHTWDRLITPLKSDDDNARLAGLQLIPFVLQQSHLSAATLGDLLDQLSVCASDKSGNVASWALLAIASCTNQPAAKEGVMVDSLQLWHIGARALTYSATCRAASSQLHAMLARGVVQYHDVGEDVEAIITAADTSGPVLLCDSSIFLMMHLLNVRVTEVPGASLVACSHATRWLLSRWNPAERTFAVQSAVHVAPVYLVDLLRTSLGLPRLAVSMPTTTISGLVAQAWELHVLTQDVVRYLLLLDEHLPSTKSSDCASCPAHPTGNNDFRVQDTGHFQSIRKLILELTFPKLSDLLQIWQKHNEDRSSPVSADALRRTIDACITLLLLMPHYEDAGSPQLNRFQTDLHSLILEMLRSLNESENRDFKGSQTLFETVLQSVQPYLPPCGSSTIAQLLDKTPDLQRFFVQVAEVFDRRRSGLTPLAVEDGGDLMDMDDDFGTQQSHGRAEGQKLAMPRHDLPLQSSSESFYTIATCRLMLLAAMGDISDIAGLVPVSFIDGLLSMENEELLSCRGLLMELLQSDLTIDEGDAARLVRHLGEQILGSDEYGRSEIALGLLLDVLVGLGPLWVAAAHGSALADDASQLYAWFITKALPKDIASPAVLKGIARLLILLMRIDDEPGIVPSLPSPRTSLFEILSKANSSAQFYIGKQLPEIFELYTLAKHDEVLVDLLENLPSDPERLEGMALRLFVLAKLASTWPTLLRRCIYHIFETPGKISDCIEYAARCLSNVSSELKLDSPRELFQLFSPQLLFTWLEFEPLTEIPFQIFGYTSLKDLIADSQEEAAALMVMRGQNDAVSTLSGIANMSEAELLRHSFTKVLGYSVAGDIASNPTMNIGPNESHTKKCLGEDVYFESVNLHFTDIISLLFNSLDHGDAERYLKKQKEYVPAAQIMAEIKSISSSKVTLPPNQQPIFRVKNLIAAIHRLCSRTPYEPTTLFTPPLIVSIARKLLSTVHPALGSLHACSILRKLRILISLSGAAATDGYPLEMLLHSIRPFITDAECADDAIGIVQYLIDRGSEYLHKAPSFVAGLTLSIFGSLRAFLNTPPASTTQESQYRETMSRAQKFHAWVGNFIKKYNPSSVEAELKSNFRALVQSGFKIGSVGNAEINTAESDLLFRLLEDEKAGGFLLSRPSRELAFKMLCSDFQVPASFRVDILGSDNLAVENATVVWKSCRGESTSKEYLSWAARVLGRAFAASGHVSEALLQESTLSQIEELGVALNDPAASQACILGIVQSLTLGHDRSTAGLAEIALRLIVTHADEDLERVCNKILPQTLNVASRWLPYLTPPSDTPNIMGVSGTAKDSFTADAILRPCWPRDVATFLACSMPDNPLLIALVPLLREVPSFAGRVFAFVLHIVLSTPSKCQLSIKKKISHAFTIWFDEAKAAGKDNLKMVINSILYLRTQVFPTEKSVADRSQWLEIDYLKAAIAAKNCGMFKTSLLFTEHFYADSAPVKSSRRSSAIGHDHPEFPTEILLTIFENIDDPDLYYGVQQNASFGTIQARLDYERDGLKSLAFRGAQYDSHVRRRAPQSTQDVHSLVSALNVLGQSGLSHSLLQAQATVGMSAASLESMFQTARKLEQWDIPVPTSRPSNAVTLYKAFQAVNNAPDYSTMLRAIDEGLDCTMASLVREDLGASALHGSLQTLAALVEMDEVLSSKGSLDLEEILARFRGRQEWMKIGKFEDVNQVLSCRGTTFSTLGQQARLHKTINVGARDTRFVEVENALLSSELTRAHVALQESLSAATSLIDLIPFCNDLGLKVDIAIHLEASNALWDQGEFASSIRMLQSLEREKPAPGTKQDIVIGRSKLLSQIGSRVSDARMEKPDRILENYLKPALHELKGKSQGVEAGQVYHQFAVFCDQQLQDADGLEELERLKRMKKTKEDDIRDLTKLYSSPSTRTKRVQDELIKSKSWLKLDKEELQRQVTNRDEFLRQSLENYLLALSASDEHDNNALRFTSLWLEHSDTRLANEAVSKHLARVASRKFAPLINQLTSRLQDTSGGFQQLLFALVLRIASDHPFHAIYQIYASANTPANVKDETATLRHNAAVKLTKELAVHQKSASIWNSINLTNRYYCQLANEKDDQKYKAGRKVSLKESPAASKLSNTIAKHPIPSPTMQIKLAADMDYSNVPVMIRFEPTISIASGVKGGNDDLRQDAIMEQVFEQVSELLRANRSTRQRNLSIRTYKVMPLTSTAGIIEFVPNTIPLHEYLMPAHERYYPKDLKGNQCRKVINDAQKESHKVRVEKYRSVTERFHPALRYFFTEKFLDPDEWFTKRLAYTRSTAAISILGHVLGLGDRHGHNILLDTENGEVIHIDLGIAFEWGRVLPVPELVPFRLTRDIVDGMGITKTEGAFRRCCEFTLETLRKEVYSIMTILDVLRYDPLYSWSVSPVRLAKLQEGQTAALEDTGTVKEVRNEPDEAHRALTVISKKLQKTLSVTATVNDLINQATDENNLAVLYSGKSFRHKSPGNITDFDRLGCICVILLCIVLESESGGFLACKYFSCTDLSSLLCMLERFR
ncbi:Telomere length regulation 1, partial [Hyphodiscus hymeniophilus]